MWEVLTLGNNGILARVWISVPAKPLCRAIGAQPLAIGAKGASENKFKKRGFILANSFLCQIGATTKSLEGTLVWMLWALHGGFSQLG